MQTMIATGKLRKGAIIMIIMYIIDIIVVYFFVPIYGLYGWMLKFLISPILFFVFYNIYFKKLINFRLFNKNLILMAYLVMAFISEILIEKYLTHGYKINFLIGITLTVAAIRITPKQLM